MKFSKIVGLAFLPALFISGCRSVCYSDLSGRKVQITVVGFDTKIGALEAHAPDGTTLTVNNLDTTVDSAPFTTINNALSKVPNVPVP